MVVRCWHETLVSTFRASIFDVPDTWHCFEVNLTGLFALRGRPTFDQRCDRTATRLGLLNNGSQLRRAPQRSALLITDTELKVMAALAIIGLSSSLNRIQDAGAIGTPSVVDERKTGSDDIAHRRAAQPTRTTMPRRSP
jgi:hypothetical protein